jgi:hypothetical protein
MRCAAAAAGNICWMWLRMTRTATGKNAIRIDSLPSSKLKAEGHGGGGRGQCLQMAVFQQRHEPVPPPHPPQGRLRRVIPAVAKAPSRTWLLSGATAAPFPHRAAASRQARAAGVLSAGGQVGCWMRSQGVGDLGARAAAVSCTCWYSLVYKAQYTGRLARIYAKKRGEVHHDSSVITQAMLLGQIEQPPPNSQA